MLMNFVLVGIGVLFIIIFILLLVAFIIPTNTAPPRCMVGIVEYRNAPTNRNAVNSVHVYVKCKSSSLLEVPEEGMIHNDIVEVLQISASLPDGTSWSIVAKNICENIYRIYPVDGVSTQIKLEEGYNYIYTKGWVSPLDLSC